MPVQLQAPRPEDLHPVAGVRLGVTEAGVRKANRKDLTVITPSRLRASCMMRATASCAVCSMA